MTHHEIKEVIDVHSNFTAVETFLQSEEGGKFRVVDRDGDRCLIRYEKGSSNMELSHSRWFRSIVWDTVRNRPLCIAPPKSCSIPFPYQNTEDAILNGLHFEELLDGVMINAYKCVGDDHLYLATRSKLNATGHFYSAKPFRQLFVESVMETTIDNASLIDSNTYIEGRIQTISRSLPSPDSTKGEISTFFSFVIQHTENRIVVPIYQNIAFLVQSGVVYEDGRFDIDSQPYELAHSLSLHPVPKSSMIQSPDMNFQAGFVAKDKNDHRWTVRFDYYQKVKELRGNFASDLERFIHLFQQDNISDYLVHYPEDKIYIQFHQMLIRKLSSYLYLEYVNVHIKRNKLWSECDKMIQPHLYGLHGLYMSQKKKITTTTIMEYLRNLPWQRLSFLIRRMEDQYGTEDSE